ncbi:uncharacterized membrane protein YoaT (DUF817 family) [Deinobacterium chartae]|uniref:Uncharacterized membrane protein YoaT (DUF817 family) n=1 Tax=Deinobacterium chartae TaxID=521158 RepID=A0A841I095_9DEIO|nr:DUF817 domain-containing protein [Deinobacterium chartae]MBB6098536.1 uncharacterized membrane protein YoaT (DUF817 family) [Deinobacterium chartae]
MLARAATRATGQLLRFAWAEALCCLFPAAILLMLAITAPLSGSAFPRYDLLLAGCLLMQVLMLRLGLETRDELKVICVFHVLGLALEVFKVSVGSWSYPDGGFFKVFGVPLYSGFMYASVASYLCQAWRRFDLEVSGWAGNVPMGLLAAGIYLNFFTHHSALPDLRWPLALGVLLVARRTRVHFTVGDARYAMPLPLAFALIGFFIWVAENLATLVGAWQYPHQASGWDWVHTSKIGSWGLLVIVSFITVALLKKVKSDRHKGQGTPPVHR